MKYKRIPRRYITLPVDLTTFDLLQSVKNSLSLLRKKKSPQMVKAFIIEQWICLGLHWLIELWCLRVIGRQKQIISHT